MFRAVFCAVAAERVEGEGLTHESREKATGRCRTERRCGKGTTREQADKKQAQLPFIMPSKIPPCNYQRKTICGYHKRAVAAVKFSPGGTLLGSACESTTVCPTARKRVAHFPGEFFLKCENAGSGEGFAERYRLCTYTQERAINEPILIFVPSSKGRYLHVMCSGHRISLNM